MKNTMTLIIGGVNMSEFTERENYSVKKIWKTENSFTNYDGNEITQRSGWNYHLKASFENIPDEIMKELTAALDSDSIIVTFTDPHSSEENGCTTESFLRGNSTGGSVSCELDDGLRWELGIDLDSQFHAVPADGL